MICPIIVAPIPKLVHDTVGDFAFYPPFIRVYDLSAASIYDDYDMLCLIVGHLHSEIKQGTVSHIKTVLSCLKDAAHGSKTALALDGVLVLNELIEWNGGLCDPAMKAFWSAVISAVVLYYAFGII